VEVLRPEGAPPPKSVEKARPALPAESREEQKSLVNRLITRIRSI